MRRYSLIIILSILLTACGSINIPGSVASCTVGLVGWPASITFQGSGSSSDCGKFSSQYPGEYYMLSSDNPSVTLISCEGDIVDGKPYYLATPSGYYRFDMPTGLVADTHYIVKTASGYNPIGDAVCRALLGPS